MLLGHVVVAVVYVLLAKLAVEDAGVEEILRPAGAVFLVEITKSPQDVCVAEWLFLHVVSLYHLVRHLRKLPIVPQQSIYLKPVILDLMQVLLFDHLSNVGGEMVIDVEFQTAKIGPLGVLLEVLHDLGQRGLGLEHGDEGLSHLVLGVERCVLGDGEG